MAQQQERDKKFHLDKITYLITCFVLGAIAQDVIVRIFQGSYGLTVIMLTATILIGGRVLPGGPLRRDAYGGILAVRLLVLLLVIAYPFLCWAIVRNLPPGFWASFLPITLFSLMITLLGWQSLRRVAGINEIWQGTTLLLSGAGVILLGVSAWQQGMNLWGIAGMVTGIGLILIGVSAWQQEMNLWGIAGMVTGIGGILTGVSAWQQGMNLFGIAMMVTGIGGILIGVSAWQQEMNLSGIAMMVTGIGGILIGVSAWQQGMNLSGIAMMVTGIGVILIGVSAWQQGMNLFGIAVILAGVGIVAGGPVFLVSTRGTSWKDEIVDFIMRRDDTTK